MITQIVTYTFVLPFLLFSRPQVIGAGAEIKDYDPELVNTSRPIKVSVRGSDIIQADGSYDWSIPDGRIGGVHINWLSIKMAPEWMTGGMICDLPQRQHWQTWFDFVIAADEHYHPEYIEIWNEPDAMHGSDEYAPHFGCIGDGEQYGEFVDYLYEYVKPHIQADIIIGALMNMDHDFIWNMFDEVEHGTFDGVSFHCYEYYYGALPDTCQDKYTYLSAWTGKSVYLSESSVIYRSGSIAEYEQAQVEHWRRLEKLPTVSFFFMVNDNGWPSPVNCDMISNGQPRPVWYLYAGQ